MKPSIFTKPLASALKEKCYWRKALNVEHLHG